MPKRTTKAARFLDADRGSVLRNTDGALLNLPYHAIPHAQRAMTMKAHNQEARQLARTSDALWEYEKEQWLHSDDDASLKESQTASTLSDFLPATLTALPQASTWRRAEALVNEAMLLGDISPSTAQELIDDYGLTADEFMSFCVGSLDGDGPAEQAAGFIDSALRVLSAMHQQDAPASSATTFERSVDEVRWAFAAT